MSILTLARTGCSVLALLIISSICKAQPNADFTATPTAGCTPLVVNFTDLSGNNPTQWQWDLGNGTLSFLQNPSVTYFNPGQYTVKLVVQNAGGIDSIIKVQYITVYAQPVVNFNGSPLIGCYPLPVNFTDLSTTANGTIDLWQWDFGDGTISSLQNPSHIYTATGNYNVSLFVRNTNGCFKTLTRTSYIQISNGVHANFSSSNPNSCAAPVNINFQNLSTGTGALTYLWNFGDGGTSTAANPTHNYTTSGTYTVQLIVTNSVGCTDTIIRTNAVSIGNVHADFNSPASICVNNAFTFTNASTPAPVSVSWNFGDGTTSTATNPVKFYTSPGIYQVKLVSNFGACKDSITKNIIVLAKPAGAFTATPLQFCKAPLTVNFTNTSVGAVSYEWIFGDGNTSTQINPTHTYTSTGNYSVTLISTNTNGCTDTLIKQDYVLVQLPQVTIDNLPQQGCAPLTWTFTSTLNSSEPATTYHWDFGDGATSTLANPTHTFGVGNFDIQLIITTASGCTDTVTVTDGIRTGTKPVANFNATPRDACAHTPVNFFDLSTGTVTQWLWDFGDGSTAITQNPTHIYEDTGYFTVSLVIWNNGCRDSISFTNYVHINPPIALFAVVLDCIEPLKRTFTDQSIGADEWNWDFGDGNTSTVQNPVHVYAAPGIYNVTLLVRNYTTGCSYSKTRTEQVVVEHANFNASDTVICRNNDIIFTATGSNASNISSYDWTFGDGGIANGSPATHNYQVSGLYDVSLLITDINGCKDSLIKQQYIRVNGPTANFGVSATGSCLLSAINFTDSSASDGIHPITQWIWDYGDGIIDTLNAGPFLHTYASPGIYTVTLHVTDNNGCTDSIVKISLLTISTPLATFTADTLSCPAVPIHFINNSSGPATYIWDFGDGSTITTPYPNHTYLTDGIYTVKLLVIDPYGCRDSMTRVNYIRITTPLAAFSVSDSAGTCPPLIVGFTNASQNYSSLNWNFGDGTSSTNPNPSHFYNIPGSYNATLTVTGPAGCTSVKQQTITIKGPQGSFTYAPLSGCSPLQVNFTASTQARISFIWDFSDGTTVSTTDSVISHTYTTPGNYVPKMILLDAGGCVVAITGSDTIHVYDVTAGIGFNSQTFCNTGTVQFNSTTVSNDQVLSYNWDFADGTTSTLQNPTHTYNTAGIYYPTLNVTTQSGCTDSIISIIPVKIVSAPQALINQSTNGCIPVSVTFNGALSVADTSALNWQWNFGNGHTSTLQNPPAEIYSVAGNFPVSLLVTNSSGCMDTVLSSVSAFSLPTVSAGVDTMICKGIGRTLIATGAANYTWTPSTGLSCTNCANPVATPDSMITYIVSGTNAQGCSDTDSVIVKVQYPFIMNHSPGDTLCIGSSLNLFASGAYTYTWSPATGLNNTTSANPIAAPLVSTTYRVIGKDDKNCFSDTAFIPIAVYGIPTVEAGPDKTINVGQTVDLIPVISTDVIDVMWTPTGSIFRNIYPAVTVKPRETTTYTVTVKNAGGCTARDNVTVYVICNGANVFIPNTFSPNGDGANDIFYPRGTGLFNIKTARVFNRWGEVVYEKSGFLPNDASAGWDGTYKGKKLGVDIYVYVIEILCDNNTLLVYKGNIALIK